MNINKYKIKNNNKHYTSTSWYLLNKFSASDSSVFCIKCFIAITAPKTPLHFVLKYIYLKLESYVLENHVFLYFKNISCNI